MTHLFEPFQQRGITFRNRIGVSPMCQYSSTDGFATDWHLTHLVSRAVGGAGLVFTEAAAVEPEGRISPSDLGIWSDRHIEPLTKITNQIRQAGTIAGIQIAHAGRKASNSVPWEGGKPVDEARGGWRPVFAPSAIAFNQDNSPVPLELDLAGIQRVKTAFFNSAKRSVEAGFQVIEIHAAHGYLLHEFLSPLSNQRQDAYGGSFENRIRLLLEIASEVRAVVPDRLPVWVRISATDWIENGWDIDQSVALAHKLKALGIDAIDASSGGILLGAKIQLGAGYQTTFSDRIRRETGIHTAAVGLITSPEQADHIIRTGQADVVLIGREFLRDPYWAARAANKLGVKDFNYPVQYQRAWL
ncbi:NADH:flavin oxidoreductase/NADH oxidase [Tumidithrix elongata RA019]|uniref:NADH:flavin oxidoreductase/NADH oxidase n=1 Tax=Tumidithrix elongata BACA0141 TaxID=2716417 RepID=A0AAW9Q6H7_9CYAN|nr:NADH:flavin oxidoreductase/NADH oxidase [Tumidithrix elongata RA019]